MTPRLSRRQAMEVLAGAGAWALVSGCSSSTSTAPTDDKPSPQSEVTSAQLESEVRDLHLRLSARAAEAEIVVGLSTSVYSFDAEVLDGDPASVTPSASYLGPTLHVHQGQRVKVSFENDLSEDCIVHWHGLTLPQDQDGQPGDAVAGGETYEYDFTVTNEPGTYWYHPHPHGSTGEQVYRGLAGLLVVHGDEPDLPDGDNDLPLVLQDRTVDADGQLLYVANRHDTMAGFVGDTLVTNGVAGFTVEVRREAYRLRVLNGANSRTQYLSWSTGEPCHVLSTDGRLLPETTSTAGVIITPAQRTDLWIDFSEFEPGQQIELLVADTFTESGGADLNLVGQVAARFTIIDSEPVPSVLPTTLSPTLPIASADAVNTGSPKQFVLSTRRAAHWINDTQWEGRVATEVETVTAGTVELWEFVNESPMPHPMHLHGNPFQVVSRAWDNDSLAQTWASLEHGIVEGGLRDTVLVWPGQRVQIAVRFAEHLGYFLYHCHILEHEDGGMMRNFLVT